MLNIGLSPAFMPPDDSRTVFGKNTHLHGIRHGKVCL